MEDIPIRDAARKLVEMLPDDATWDDLLYLIYVRQSVEAGLEDFRQGRVAFTDEVLKRLSG